MRRSDMDDIEILLDDDPAEAVSVCRKLCDQTPDDADVWGWLAEAQVAAGDYDGALKSYAEYAVRDPEWLEAYTTRAELMAELGRFDAAEVELEVARAMDSQAPLLLKAEALWFDLQGQFAKADELYARMAEADRAALAASAY